MRLDAKAFGLACGVILGLLGFVGTLFSLIFGGGQTISMLAAVYFGYSWTIFGAFLALVQGFIYGFIWGWIFAAVYNRFARAGTAATSTT